MKLTLKELHQLEYVVLKNRAVSDYDEIISTEYVEFLSVEKSEIKKELITEKYSASKFIGEDAPNPDGNLYFSEETGELVEYIPLDKLRFKIEETLKREVDDNFNLGKIAWARVIEEVELGEKVGNSFIAFDDINVCYKARHPRSKQTGFNIRCLEQFYRENVEKIISVSHRVNQELEIDKEINTEIRQFEAKKKREAKRRKILLQTNLGGLV